MAIHNKVEVVQFFKIYVFNLFLAVLGLCCCIGFSLFVVSRDYPLAAVHRLLIAVASLIVEHSFWGMGASVSVAHGLRSCGSGLQSTGSIDMAHRFHRPAACGIFPDQGWNLCSLHEQKDSLPMSHQGNPKVGHFESERGPSANVFHARESRLLCHTSLLHQNLLLAHMHGF